MPVWQFAIPAMQATVSQPRGIMNKGIAIALLVGGIVLAIFGINATNSFGSDVSRFFTGSPTDKAVWMLIGGIVAAVVGLFGMMRGAKG